MGLDTWLSAFVASYWWGNIPMLVSDLREEQGGPMKRIWGIKQGKYFPKGCRGWLLPTGHSVLARNGCRNMSTGKCCKEELLFG